MEKASSRLQGKRRIIFIHGGPSGLANILLTLHQELHFCTRKGYYLDKRFCKMFLKCSTFVLQLPSCPGKQGELCEKCLQNLMHK